MAPSVEARLEIAQIKAKYCRIVDQKKWDLFEQIAVPGFSFKMVQDGAVVNQNGMDMSFTDRASFVQHFSEHFRNLQCHHLVGPAEYEEIGPDEVKAVFAIQYYVAEKGLTPKMRVAGGAHYSDVFKRVDGSWLLADSSVESTFTVIDS